MNNKKKKSKRLTWKIFFKWNEQNGWHYKILVYNSVLYILAILFVYLFFTLLMYPVAGNGYSFSEFLHQSILYGEIPKPNYPDAILNTFWVYLLYYARKFFFIMFSALYGGIIVSAMIAWKPPIFLRENISLYYYERQEDSKILPQFEIVLLNTTLKPLYNVKCSIYGQYPLNKDEKKGFCLSKNALFVDGYYKFIFKYQDNKSEEMRRFRKFLKYYYKKSSSGLYDKNTKDDCFINVYIEGNQESKQNHFILEKQYTLGDIIIEHKYCKNAADITNEGKVVDYDDFIRIDAISCSDLKIIKRGLKNVVNAK